jgi:hypothetical protein
VVKASRAAAFGMRRVSWVRIDLTGPQPYAEVAGVGQHRPVIRSVPLSVATGLAAEGVRTIVRRPTEPHHAGDELAEVG